MGCEGHIATEEVAKKWHRDKNNKKKNYYCTYCWTRCLTEWGGGQAAEEDREHKKETSGAWNEDQNVPMDPWKSAFDFDSMTVDFWAEIVPCSQCVNTCVRGQMYVGKKQKTMWCYECQVGVWGDRDAPCFMTVVKDKYSEYKTAHDLFCRWIDWLEQTGCTAVEVGPGLGGARNIFGPYWRDPVITKNKKRKTPH